MNGIYLFVNDSVAANIHSWFLAMGQPINTNF